MIDFAASRRMMVDGQVRTSDVTDLRIIAAMLDVPRERFVPESNAALAYLDLDVAVSRATGGEPVRRLLKPMVLAKMVQAAAVKAGDRVLDVGCATGYSSAILGRLAHSVVALEEDPALARNAEGNLRAVGASNVTVATGPLTQGWQAKRPLRRHLRQWGDRGRSPRAVHPARRRGTAGGCGRPCALGPGNTLPLGRRRCQWMADLRCRRAAAAGFCSNPGLCLLTQIACRQGRDVRWNVFQCRMFCRRVGLHPNQAGATPKPQHVLNQLFPQL